MIAFLLILGGAVFGVLGTLHATLCSICATRDDLSLPILRLRTRLMGDNQNSRATTIRIPDQRQ